MSGYTIDILLGADVHGELLLGGLVKSSSGTPIAQQTIFSWVISGPVLNSASSHFSRKDDFSDAHQRRITSAHLCVTTSDLDEDMRKFWELEEIPQVSPQTPAEERSLPIAIGESFSKAEKLFLSLSRRFQRDNDLFQEYDEFMSDYERLGHMAEVPRERSMDSQSTMIPHHPVIQDSSVTSRLRVVFNASCVTSNGTSLNDHLLAGPKLQADLPSIILKWRQFKFVYTADVAKMYWQILVDSRDSCYQRIFWKRRNDSTKIFELLTVTYGTASTPFLALRVVKQLASDKGHEYPLATPIISSHMYVDDVLFGANNKQTIRQMRNQLITLLKRGGFDLRKWASNSSELLADIDSENHRLACQRILNKDDKLKVLDISWHPLSDCFRFNVSIANETPRTKRTILSAIAKLYDPLGWVTPATITAKIFMQLLWRFKVKWDSDIPPTLFQSWCDMYSQFPLLNEIQLTRWTHQDSDSIRQEIHGFADASSAAYAAVVYLKTITSKGEIHLALLAGKSKVAPVKSLTISRLELSAAALLSRLIKFVRSSISVTDESCFCWTDSTIVLSWLNQHASVWKTFVTNRVALIHSNTPNCSWRHVPSGDNPADCASRGLLSKDLLQHPLWWSGPPWLMLDSDGWPTEPHGSPPVEDLDFRLISTHVANPPVRWSLSQQFSSWPKLICVAAYVFKFIQCCRSAYNLSRSHVNVGCSLSSLNCQKARTFWLKSIQQELFSKELVALNENKSVSSKSLLFSLNPFIDHDGLLRVGGRLSNAPISFTVKHPILLAAHPLVDFIIRYAHHRALHAGLALTLATLRQEFWILRSRNLTKAVLHKCVTCA